MSEERLEWSPGGFVEIRRMYGAPEEVANLNDEPSLERTVIRYQQRRPARKPGAALCRNRGLTLRRYRRSPTRRAGAVDLFRIMSWRHDAR